MNYKRRRFRKDSKGVSVIVETSVAATIVIVILTLFFTSLTSLYEPYRRTDVDTQGKIVDVVETLINSQGQTKYYTSNWEDYDTDNHKN